MMMTTEQERDVKLVRTALEQAPDVKRVVGLKMTGPDAFLYLIETPFETHPKFVLGTTDATLADVHPRIKSGALWSMREHWLDLTGELLPEELEVAA